MCGVTGFWITDESFGSDAPHILSRMSDALAHRGPDSDGQWSDKNSQIYMGHRRLAILELSEQGAQPMHSSSSRYVLVYNGEIYNHLEIRKELERDINPPAWRGSSDTETVLASFDHWGIDATLKRLNGMFAIAVWDREEKSLTLARDKIGEKPLYFLADGRRIVWGSELQPFREFGHEKLEIDREAVGQFLAHANVPSPRSIYKDIYKLEPGTRITFDSPVQSKGRKHSYWNLLEAADSYTELPERNDINSWQLLLKKKLVSSVRSRTLADVSIGSFLSGGIDSSLVTSVMQEASNIPVKTFSIGFEEQSHNEAVHAKAVAEHLGTDHTELYVGNDDLLDVIPKLGGIWDEPFADSSQIPTFLVSQLTQQHVSVALSGDGGDELFGGYRRYHDAEKLWRQLSKYPFAFRKAAVQSAATLDPFLKGMPNGVAGKLRRLINLAPLISCKDENSLYLMMTRHWKDPNRVLEGCSDVAYPVMLSDSQCSSYTRRMMHLDTHTYLPNDILTKVDRAAMAVSLECRAPLLDPELVAFAWTIPIEHNVQSGQGKLMLKTMLHDYIPKALVERPKMGFAVPIAEWLRGPLKSWAEDLLAPELIKRQGFFDHEKIGKIWIEHQNRTWAWEYLLWDVLMFQSWLSHHHHENR